VYRLGYEAMSEVTQILNAIEAGDAQAAAQLLPLHTRQAGRGSQVAKATRSEKEPSERSHEVIHAPWIQPKPRRPDRVSQLA
jgi:hypothetical protein